MSTYSLSLFLHPMCRKLAVSSAAKGRSFGDMSRVALSLARQWRWGEQKAAALAKDLLDYHKCKGPFSGAMADGLQWWESLTASAEKHPLKALAITLLSVVPHAAEVERLFSNLGGIQILPLPL